MTSDLMNIKRISQTRNSRFLYYVKGIGRAIYPKSLLNLDFKKLESRISNFDEEALTKRLDYYNQNTEPFSIGDQGKAIKDISFRETASMYWFDLMEYARYFPQESKIAYIFRDVTHIPEVPTLVKSRPIATKNQPNKNSVLFKLVKIRHFQLVNDNTPFREKKDKLIWRGATYQKHRAEFMEQFFGKTPLIDIGQHNKSTSLNPQWQMPFMSIAEQLQNKFIFSIEGNDVATNTKWALSSNSLLFMRKPLYETWFMEGRLEPGVHYVQLKDDYSDMEEKIEYYIDHPGEAEEIIHQGNLWTEQFKAPYVENWLNLKVLERYLQHSGQLQ